jgi:hypothetical protein
LLSPQCGLGQARRVRRWMSTWVPTSAHEGQSQGSRRLGQTYAIGVVGVLHSNFVQPRKCRPRLRRAAASALQIGVERHSHLTAPHREALRLLRHFHQLVGKVPMQQFRVVSVGILTSAVLGAALRPGDGLRTWQCELDAHLLRVGIGNSRREHTHDRCLTATLLRDNVSGSLRPSDRFRQRSRGIRENFVRTVRGLGGG